MTEQNQPVSNILKYVALMSIEFYEGNSVYRRINSIIVDNPDSDTQLTKDWAEKTLLWAKKVYPDYAWEIVPAPLLGEPYYRVQGKL